MGRPRIQTVAPGPANVRVDRFSRFGESNGMSKPTIGFIGLGIMGKPMARNLLRAGYPVIALNRSRGPVDELAAEGASAGVSPNDVASRSDVVITMLPDSPDVEKVLEGSDGVLATLRPGALWIDMSTIAPATARALAQKAQARGAEALDAPVSGGEKGAIDGTLSIMAGGTQAAFDRAKPIFETLGKNIVRIGENGAGQVCKACNQIVVGVTIEALAEAFALANAEGVDFAAVRSALLGGFAQSKILDMHGQRMLDGNFKPGFKAVLHRKDMTIATSEAEAHNVELLAAELVRERFDALVGRGDGELDHSAIATLYKAPATA
ncbi:MAG: 2-hydroxy-3-oxopropionate reductase [Candidatus Eremiobacteraeota bacterium]|nr:2-hydroxy-3-oxopropionate reductase [Candidatus Eremiobacteraeota bacterium]